MVFGPAAARARTKATAQWNGESPMPDVGRPASEAASAPPAGGTETHAWDIVDEWGLQSFPASDPPANW